MKTFNLSVLLLAGALFTACTNNQDNPTDTELGTPAILSVRLTSNDTKASGAPVYGNESKIGKGIVFVFRGTGANPVLDGKSDFDFASTAPTTVNVNITQGTSRHIYVVANHDNLTAFNGVTKLSDLYNIVNKYNLISMRTGTNLAMSGFTSDVVATGVTNAATVALNFVGSRIHIDWDLQFAGLTISSAYLLNTKTKTDYFSAPSTYLTINVQDYLRGKSDVTAFTTAQYYPTNATSHNYDPEMMMTSLSDKGFATNFFYVLENNSTAPTIVVLEGTHSGITYYYPIVINGDQNGSGAGGAINAGDKSSVLARGKVYNVKAIIKGFGNSAPDGPYTPLKKATIDVTITPATWTTALIDQEFN